VYPEIGSHRNVAPKKKISSSARRKFGTQMPNTANVAPARSIGVLRRTAQTIPTGKAITSEIVIANAASSRLGRRRRLTLSTTGSPLRIERPRSPRSSRPIQAAYCT
jgi:hypothetical protein